MSPDTTAAESMVWLDGGTFTMGSDFDYPEEAPAHPVAVDGFWIDPHPVTNEQFTDFVEATGYVTVAERALRPEDYPGVPPELLVPGSAVFRPPPHPVDPLAAVVWWEYAPGACWRAPDGPGSSIDARPDHPVVQVCLEDALAFAAWAGKRLPTEAQWEYAARGGLERQTYSWGDGAGIEATELANVWLGEFPHENRKPHPPGPSAPGAYAPNAYGLDDMTGNVWEWTLDYFQPRHAPSPASACCAPRNPTGAASARAEPDAPTIPLHVLKGGSFLCAPNYCLRYRPAARIAHAADSASVHIGFRCVRAPDDEREAR
jgi:sulfatase modifying factor 1